MPDRVPLADTAPTLELGPEDADAVVILLHGFGADAADLASTVPELDLPALRFVLPNAPVIKATISAGWPVSAWYDIRTMEPSPDREDPAGVRASAQRLTALLTQQEQRGVAPKRTFLAGFSQGGAMALYTGLRHDERLGGIVAMSSYLPLPASLAKEAHPINARTPVWQAHGTLDEVVPLARGQATAQQLHDAGWPVSWQTWPMGHEICDAELGALRTWLLARLGA